MMYIEEFYYIISLEQPSYNLCMIDIFRLFNVREKKNVIREDVSLRGCK